MKKLGTYLVVFLMTCMLFQSDVKAQEAFTIDDLHVDIVVSEDGSYQVQETYTMDFKQYRHGFYRTIPTVYDMKWTDSETGSILDKRYFFPVSNINCGKKLCDTSYESGGVVIKMGDPDEEVIGEQRYQISYKVQTKDLDYYDNQMLYWNLIGNGFDTQVKKMSYTIEMPKAFDVNNIFTSTGGYLDSGQDLSYRVDGNTISGELLAPLSNYESATIKVNLPNQYFTFPVPVNTVNYGLLVSGVFVIIAALLFFKFGRDDKVFVTVEFKAPQGLDSAGVGFVVDNLVDNKDIISLIIDWANRGYISIEDDEHSVKLHKLKDMEKENTTPYERTFFQAIFKDSDIVDEEGLKKEHIGTALASAKSQLSRYFGTAQRRIYTSSSTPLQVLMCVLIAIPSALCGVAALYMHYGMIEMALPALLLGLLTALSCVPWIYLMRKRYVLKKLHFIGLWSLFFFINIIVITITAIIIYVYADLPIHALLYALGEIIMIFFMMFMDKRTKQGNLWLGQILGLKEFILTCEKEKLELLVHENPTAFFDILPYAYVLGVSDVWSKKFENIIMSAPTWYQSSSYHGDVFSTYLWWSYFHHSFRNVSSATTYVAHSTSGVGGGSIGGFGGGFSGGGFGGGGGGSW